MRLKVGDLVTPIIPGGMGTQKMYYSLHVSPDPDRTGRDKTGLFMTGSVGVILEIDRGEALVSCADGIGWIWKGNLQALK